MIPWKVQTMQKHCVSVSKKQQNTEYHSLKQLFLKTKCSSWGGEHIYIYIYIYIYAHPPMIYFWSSKASAIMNGILCIAVFLMHIRSISVLLVLFKESMHFWRKNLMILWSCLFYGNAFFAFVVFIPESFQFHNIHFKHVELRI